MTDQDLELRLRAWYGANVPATEPAPTGLRAAVLAIPQTAPGPLLRIDRGRPFILVAAAALVALAVAGAMLVGGLSPHTLVPSPTPRVTELPSATAQAVAPTGTPALPPIAGMISDWRDVFAASDSVAWVVSSSAAYRTDDLGATWRDVTLPSFDAQFWSFTIVDANTAYAAPPGPLPTIYATHDGGLTWSPAIVDSAALSGPPVLSFSTPMSGWATFFAPGSASLTDPGSLLVYTTTDGGSNWTRSGSGAVPQLKGGIPKLLGPIGGYLWQSAGKADRQPFNNRFYLSDDGGVTWSSYTFPISGISPKNELKEIVGIVREADGHFLIGIQALVSDHDLAIYESTDDPATWRLVYQVPDVGSSVQFLTPTTWIVASPEVVRTTVDAGAHWTSVTPDPYPGFWHVHFATARTGWARVGGTGDPNTLIVTTDGGATWRRVGS